MRMNNEKNKKSIFVIIALVLIMVCAAIAISSYMNSRWEKMRDIKRKGDIKQIQKAVLSYVKCDIETNS